MRSVADAECSMLSAKRLAQRLDLSERKVWSMDAAGELPRAVRLGRLVKWRRAEIEEWEAAGCPDRKTWESR